MERCGKRETAVCAPTVALVRAVSFASASATIVVRSSSASLRATVIEGQAGR